MLLLFWRLRAPSYGVAALSARPSGTSTFVRARMGVGRASAVASGTSTGERSELNTVAVATLATRSTATVVGVHGASWAATARATAILATAPGIGGRQGSEELRVTSRATSVGRHASLAGSAGWRGEVILLATGVQVGHVGRLRLSGTTRIALTAVRALRPQIPMQQLVPIDLGTGYRGDTMILPVWVALTREGEPYDLEGGVLRFTAKEDLVLPDAAPHVIQCSTLDGGVTILEPPLGHCYRVRIEPGETQTLKGDTVFTFDVQLFTDSANVYTIRRGLLTVIRDVTRSPA